MAARRTGGRVQGRRKAASSAGSGVRLLHLDTFSGIAGNMLLGALLDLGLPRRGLVADLEGLGIPFQLRVSRVRRGPIAARYVSVLDPARGRRRKASGHRRYRDVRRILDRARLAPAVRDRAQAIFAALAAAEARVHGIPVEEVHFHEVGAVDALVDVTGAAAGLERLGIGRVTASPVALGHGSVESDHGRLPLPAPATLELLRGVPTVPAGTPFETVTPTGAAILRTVVDEFRTLPAMTPEAVGHGAGDDRPTPLPNVLRAILGREEGLRGDRIVALECNLDDWVPEHFDHVMARLFDAGALDVALQHLQMKKNRPGFLLRVLASPERRVDLAALLLAETSTLGVRVLECERILLERQVRRVATPYGRIAVKLVRRPGGRLDAAAEYEDARRAAERTGTPLRQVVRAAEAAALREGEDPGVGKRAR